MTCLSTSGRHDRATDYTNHNCRCPAARADRERVRKLGHLLPPARVPAVGARRRLRALMTQGHSQNDLNVLLGRKPCGSLGSLLWRETSKTVTRAVHDRVAEIYDELWRTPGTGGRAAVVRQRALTRGWATPLELDDDRIDDPAYVPTLHRLTPQIAKQQQREQVLTTVAQLTDRDVPASQIARHIGSTARSVQRYRKALREAS